MDDFEALLTRELHQLVDGEHPSPELRERIAHDLSSAPSAPSRRSRRWMPAAAAALLVVAGIGAIVSTRSDDGGVDLATDPDQGTVLDDAEDRDDDRDTTPTTAATTTIAPLTTEVTDTTIAPLPADDEEAPSLPAAEPGPGSGPATTVPQCQNSTDPSCGSFHWSPQPTNQPATLSLSVPDRVVAGESVDLRLDMADPDGPVTISCHSVNIDPNTSTATGGCGATERPPPCPERYGPWSPPAPNGGQASTTSSVTFHEAGTYTVTVNVTRPDGCDNVDPYRSGATATLTVEVVAE